MDCITEDRETEEEEEGDEQDLPNVTELGGEQERRSEKQKVKMGRQAKLRDPEQKRLNIMQRVWRENIWQGIWRRLCSSSPGTKLWTE